MKSQAKLKFQKRYLNYYNTFKDIFENSKPVACVMSVWPFETFKIRKIHSQADRDPEARVCRPLFQRHLKSEFFFLLIEGKEKLESYEANSIIKQSNGFSKQIQIIKVEIDPR